MIDGRMPEDAGKLYPSCGCPPDTHPIMNVVCRNADCIDYGAHRRGYQDDHCQWCRTLYTLLFVDPLKGAR